MNCTCKSQPCAASLSTPGSPTNLARSAYASFLHAMVNCINWSPQNFSCTGFWRILQRKCHKKKYRMVVNPKLAAVTTPAFKTLRKRQADVYASSQCKKKKSANKGVQAECFHILGVVFSCSPSNSASNVCGPSADVAQVSSIPSRSCQNPHSLQLTSTRQHLPLQSPAGLNASFPPNGFILPDGITTSSSCRTPPPLPSPVNFIPRVISPPFICQLMPTTQPPTGHSTRHKHAPPTYSADHSCLPLINTVLQPQNNSLNTLHATSFPLQHLTRWSSSFCKEVLHGKIHEHPL